MPSARPTRVVSNDNPFSEAHFKTLKYRPDFPEFFPSIEAARAFMADTFVPWYNNEHRHSGLAFLTPADVHFGRAHDVLERRNERMQQAFMQHPRRFAHGPAQHALAPVVYINRPTDDASCALGNRDQTTRTLIVSN